LLKFADLRFAVGQEDVLKVYQMLSQPGGQLPEISSGWLQLARTSVTCADVF